MNKERLKNRLSFVKNDEKKQKKPGFCEKYTKNRSFFVYFFT